MGSFIGLVIIVLGIQKIAEDRNFRYIYFKQKKIDSKLNEISSFIDKTYEKVDVLEEEPEQPLETVAPKNEEEAVLEKSFEKTKEEIYYTIDRLAKKMLEIENKVNQISKGIVENWGRLQEEQLIETSKPKAATKSTGRILKSNSELKEKLKKAMGG